MELRPEQLTADARYKLLSGAIVPRFIAWVATGCFGGETNLAPFSYATVAAHDPMSLLFVVAGHKPNGEAKDTLRRARPVAEGGRGEFVLHVVDEAMAESMAKSAGTFEFGQSEIDTLGLRAAAGSRVAAPRLLDAKVAFECCTTQIVSVGVSSVIFGEVVAIHAADGVIDAQGRVDPEKLAAVGRMAGSSYLHTHDRFTLDDARARSTRPH